MKPLFLLFFFIFSISAFSQSSVLVLQKLNTNFTKEIKEHKRIKVWTKDGQKLYGRFTIIDSSSIQIEGKVILLDEIVMMKKRSLFATITNPIFIATGFLFIAGGIIGVSAGGYGYIAAIALLPPGIAISLISILSNKHESEKWEYLIKLE